MTTLVACVETSPTEGEINIVAVTDVYGSIASAVAGTHATVTSIINSPSQDPHEFEASARTQLALSRAQLVITNGGGYDDFMDTLLAGARNPDAKILRAVDLSPRSDAEIEANEHVWYDLDTVEEVASALAETLAFVDPPHASDYRDNAGHFTEALAGLKQRAETIAAAHAGESVLVTEPVPLYLLEAAGLSNVTPVAFSTAIEDGQGVSPVVMKDVLDLLATGDVALLVYNEQTEGPETAQLQAAAKTHGIAAIPVTETLPEGVDYLGWMDDTLTAIESALS
ncbi:MAG: zinc ABC transporter substrate-binding protein [Microbacteriaceae bacterium]|nr:zinc ABC transporter substrate-binding protein [Microbacteriaceae bacterium]